MSDRLWRSRLFLQGRRQYGLRPVQVRCGHRRRQAQIRRLLTLSHATGSRSLPGRRSLALDVVEFRLHQEAVPDLLDISQLERRVGAERGKLVHWRSERGRYIEAIQVEQQLPALSRGLVEPVRKHGKAVVADRHWVARGEQVVIDQAAVSMGEVDQVSAVLPHIEAIDK